MTTNNEFVLETEIPHNQLISNTGGTHTGIIFVPFGSDVPSEITAAKALLRSSSPRRAPIGSGGDGWVEKPDTGGAIAPIGDPVFAMMMCTVVYIGIRACRKKLLRK